MIFCLGTTPAVQRVMIFRQMTIDAVNRAVTTVECAAGKSVNVAKVLRALGQETVAAGFFGGDRGEQIRSILEAKGIVLDFVGVSARTRLCTTVLDQTTGTHTELVEEGQPLGPAEYAQLDAIIARQVPRAQAVVMSGSITTGGPTDLYHRTTQLARAAGVISVVDAQGAPLVQALTAGPGLVKPNRAELAATVGRKLAAEAAVLSAMRELSERGAERVVVTAGKDPALAFDGSRFWRITAPAIKAVNPIGSGDAFTAALVWRLLSGDDLGEACRWASAAGAANALSLLPGEMERAEMERLVGEVGVEAMGAGP